MIISKDFSERFLKLQKQLTPVVESTDIRMKATIESISERALEMIQSFMMMFLLYKEAKREPAQMEELLQMFQKEAVDEVSRQTDQAYDKLADDPLWKLISDSMGMPTLETIEGSYMQEIHRLMSVYREFFGLPMAETPADK